MRLDVFRVRRGSRMAGTVFGLPDHVAVPVLAMVSVAAGLGVVSAQSSAAPALSLSDGAPPAVQHAGCFRPLSDVIWGFLVTLLACSVAYLGRHKHTQSTNWEKTRAVFYAFFIPINDLHHNLYASFDNAMLIWKYQQSRQKRKREEIKAALRAVIFIPTLQSNIWASTANAAIWKYQQSRQFLQSLRRRRQFRELWFREFWSWLFPFSKFPGRILFQCDVVVYVEKGSINSELLLQVDRLWSSERRVKEESEAMVIGEVAVGKKRDADYERKELEEFGKVALLLAEVLPHYDELKFLRGNSGFAMTAIAIQALGYITAVIFRMVKDLPVTPLEVVGLILNIILLVQVSAYSFFNPCHRPLVIYTNPEREEKLLTTSRSKHCQELSIPWKSRTSKVVLVVISVVDLCLCGVVVYFVVKLFQVSNIFVVVPLIVYAIAPILCVMDIIKAHFFRDGAIWNSILNWSTILLYIFVYTWALVVTILYWEHQDFDIQVEPFNISQLIPFIG